MSSSAALNDRKMQMILSMEKNLKYSLKPVNPSPEFIHRLETRLTNYPQISIEKRTNLRIYIMVLMSFISAVSILWILWRYVFKRS